MRLLPSLVFGFFVCALIICASPTVRAADDTAADLFARHAAFVGWTSGDGAIKTLRASGAGVRDGVTVARFSLLRMGAIYRSSLTRSSGAFENGFTGSVFWQSNVNGFTTRTIGEVVKFLITQDAIADEALSGEAAAVHGTATLDGVNTTIVRVMPKYGLPVDLYIDPESGAFKRVAIDPDGKYNERYDVLGYADVGHGKRVISSWRYVGGRILYTYTDLQANTVITADELHPPKAVASWTFGPPAETVPVSVTDTRILIDATVNGHLGHFIFDTGAGGIALTDSFARLVGAKRLGRASISGIGGGAAANVYGVDTIAFGKSVLHDVTVLTGLDERSDGGEFSDGLIGFDLLAAAVVELDLDAGTLQILDPTQVVPDRNAGITVTLDLSTGMPRVPMTVAGHASVLAILDSGNPYYVLFNHDLISRQHVRFMPPDNALVARLRVSGVNGEETDECGRLESLELGPISYRPVPACASDSMASNEVLVGLDFVRGFNYVFDYPDGQMLITPRSKH